jgi:hypothetical protein
MEEQRQDSPQDEVKPDEKLEDLPADDEAAEDVKGGVNRLDAKIMSKAKPTD